jgi:uncharacterized short protein YbdD (DUF466 family)
MRVSGAAGQRGSGAVLERLASLLRAISGMPDYQAYIEHLRRSHPGKGIPSEREYYAEYLRMRYEDGPTRCC